MRALLRACNTIKNRQVIPTNKSKIEDLRGVRNVVSLGPAGAGGHPHTSRTARRSSGRRVARASGMGVAPGRDSRKRTPSVKGTLRRHTVKHTIRRRALHDHATTNTRRRAARAPCMSHTSPTLYKYPTVCGTRGTSQELDRTRAAPRRGGSFYQRRSSLLQNPPTPRPYKIQYHPSNERRGPIARASPPVAPPMLFHT